MGFVAQMGFHLNTSKKSKKKKKHIRYSNFQVFFLEILKTWSASSADLTNSFS